MAYQRTSSAKGKKKNIFSGVVHIYATFNNTIVTLSEMGGNTIAWSSAGAAGFKGARKSTPYAAQMASESVAQKGKAFGLKNVEVYVKGPGSGRESALRALQSFFCVTAIKDVTPIPHNGVRLRKRRRS
ncbi:MAG: 30S ribosomal protein S11 [Holosporaceae bacterium]